MAATPQNFYKIELSRALKENAFGLKGYQLLSPAALSDSYSACARVELLEGLTVFLRLTHCGYEITCDPDAKDASQSPQMEISEGLDELLRALSPGYSTLYSERLISKLRF
ncbi:hypothetical protein M408DRAFT_134088 [Serendipita vermifera MAFF 305830]|uniref:GSKIP domain-containing protein n=1 Tax=Serendipita vermifera MAFF 305830 TaxID=933852 RepID=A0A0C2XIC9_SERVB|nr:hypothetical protein M408DRAFT_134088 [Serendipita vermifera MAFF 305830]